MIRSFVLLLLVACSFVVSPAVAAEIRVERLERGSLISVEGAFVEGDDTRFKNIAIGADSAVVMFNSPGGLAHVGMEIGRTIAIKGFLTAVFDNQSCASACGLAWIAGKKRFLASTSKLGFHAVFTDQDGHQDVSSAGNALVGSYLQQLNLSANVIVYVTATRPASMQWLTAEDALRIGLEVEPLPEASGTSLAPADVPIPFGRADAQATLPAPNSTTATPHRSWQYFDYTDLPGYDLPGMPLKVSTAIECRSECEASTRCSAFTFNQAYRACFLKGMATEALQFSGAVSGYLGAASDVTRVGHDFGPSLAFRTSRNVEIVANPFAKLKGTTLAACQDQCVLTANCQGFNFYRNGMCLMFGVRKPTKANLLSVAGSRAD